MTPPRSMIKLGADPCTEYTSSECERFGSLRTLKKAMSSHYLSTSVRNQVFHKKYLSTNAYILKYIKYITILCQSYKNHKN